MSVIEAPHPLTDEGTPTVALAIYRVLNTHALLVGGAHRDANQDGSADVAHNPQTIFQVFHATFGENAIVLQIHGFAANKHPDYPQKLDHKKVALRQE